MNALKDCNYNDKVFEIILDPDVLEYRTTEEQLFLIKELVINNYNSNVYKMILNYDILESLSMEEQMILIKKYKDIKNINKILKFLNIMIIKIQSTSNNDTYKTHKECLSEINNMEEMIKYIDTLKSENGLNTDITSDSKVKVFNSIKN